MTELEKLGEKSAHAKYELQKMTTEQKNFALEIVADALVENTKLILDANEKDVKQAVMASMKKGLLDRLTLNEERIKEMAAGIKQVVELADPVGEVLDTFIPESGLKIIKKRVPIGVIGIFYESRPNVTADAFALCFKAGNAVILKGGSDAIHSNIAITSVIRTALESSGFQKDVVQLIMDTRRETATAFMKMNQFIDVLIPRGGAGLIQSVLQNSTIPVIETGTGNCHIFVDEYADLNKAISIIMNAKTQRIGVCNACESLVVHKKISDSFLPILWEALKEKNVILYGDCNTKKIVPECEEATEDDYGKEYLDLKLSVKIVDSVEEAICHINKYNTGHSEAIITENEKHSSQFLNEVDAACVYVNASTRFTDGFMFGFGAEIGISTQKLHARGPMGLRELTSYKYVIYGNGQIR